MSRTADTTTVSSSPSSENDCVGKVINNIMYSMLLKKVQEGGIRRNVSSPGHTGQSHDPGVHLCAWQFNSGQWCSVREMIPETQVAFSCGNGHQDAPSGCSAPLSSLQVAAVVVVVAAEGSSEVGVVIVGALVVVVSALGGGGVGVGARSDVAVEGTLIDSVTAGVGRDVGAGPLVG